jgi:hypothetical protein
MTTRPLPRVLASVILAVSGLWLAMHVKRLHDRDKSGWWFLLILVPIAGVWSFIETGCDRAWIEGSPNNASPYCAKTRGLTPAPANFAS